jgi:hypothetical protein
MKVLKKSLVLSVVATALALGVRPALALPAGVRPTLKEGVYRVDWNRKVRDLCIDFFTNDDLTARDWQGVLAAQGALCTVSAVKANKTSSSWVGRCEQPLIGRVGKIEHRVSVEVRPDGSFDILTVLSGDLQATIPIRGVPLTGGAAACTKETPPFRPWQ